MERCRRLVDFGNVLFLERTNAVSIQMMQKSLLPMLACLWLPGPDIRAALPAAHGGANVATAHSYADLAGRLTNLQALADLPVTGETSAEWTSRDRASTYNPGSGSYVNWDANDDGNGVIRTDPDGGQVLAEMTGPGCVWRIWSAQVGAGHVKIFLDGAATPAVDLAFQDYFNGTQAPFNFPSLVYTVCGGFDSYIPIPYNSSCKIVAYGSWGRYFHFNYTTFSPGVTVPSFKRSLDAADLAALAAVNDFLLHRLGSDPAGARTGEVTVTNSYTIAPGQSVTALDFSGPGAVTGFKVRVNGLPASDAQWAALRELTVTMAWDGEANASVWAPLGDFFGSACGYIPFRSLPLGMQPNGWMYSYWYMPFASGARIALGNDGAMARSVDVIITRAPLSGAVDELARFHAKWNRGVYVTNNGRSPDYRFLGVNGRGRFVGLALHVYQTADLSPGPWWGEGDEKFFVDGEKMPSWFGTGSEDYFGFAWGTPGYFSKAFHTQALAPPGNLFAPGNRSLNRLHIADNVPFQASFDGCLEKWAFTNENVTRYGTMPYWYQEAGGIDAYGAASVSARTNYYVPPPPAYSFTWTNAAGGFWSWAGNWAEGAVADGSGLGVNFSALDLVSNTLIHLDSPRTVGTLFFGDTDSASPAGWVLDNNGNPANKLTFAGATPGIVLSSAAATPVARLNVDLVSAGAVTQTGTGTVELGGSNSLAGLIINGGTNVIAGRTTLSGNGSSYFFLGNANPSVSGSLVLANGATLLVTNNFADNLVIGRDGGSGAFIQNGGVFIYNPGNQPYLFVGAANNAATRAEYAMNGGLLDMSGKILSVGFGAGVSITGALHQAGGVITNVGSLALPALQSFGYGNFTLLGGAIHIGSGGMVSTSGKYEINLGGGTIGASANWVSSLKMNLTGQTGPVTFDTGANTVTLTGALAGNGGLTKAGSGVLALGGAVSYTGPTAVAAGTLRLDTPGNTLGSVRLASGAVLNLKYAGTNFIGGLYTNNVALPRGMYHSGNLPGFIAGGGVILVSGVIPDVPASIRASVDGAQLTLGWPTNYAGWILQRQTNGIGVGLGTNWIDLPETAGMTSTNFLIDPKTPAMFFRLRYPSA
jgi:autotransporter-associated beta strand protein